MSASRWKSVAAACLAVLIGVMPPGEVGESATQKGAAGAKLKWLFGDIKRPLRGAGKKAGEDAITEENYRKIIDGLKANLHCNGLRVYIDPDIKNPASYPKLYRDVLEYARKQKLAIYANPYETAELRKEKFGKDKAAFADWVVKYANHFRPEFLGPFNETGWSAGDMVQIVAMVRKGLKYAPQMVGPDVIHVSKSSEEFSKNKLLVRAFDVIGSHNAAKDENATADAWRELHRQAGKPTWATENPRPWSVKNEAGKEIGIRAVLESESLEGLVLYLAFPKWVNADGSLTQKGREIEQGLATP